MEMLMISAAFTALMTPESRYSLFNQIVAHIAVHTEIGVGVAVGICYDPAVAGFIRIPDARAAADGIAQHHVTRLFGGKRRNNGST